MALALVSSGFPTRRECSYFTNSCLSSITRSCTWPRPACALKVGLSTTEEMYDDEPASLQSPLNRMKLCIGILNSNFVRPPRNAGRIAGSISLRHSTKRGFSGRIAIRRAFASASAFVDWSYKCASSLTALSNSKSFVCNTRFECISEAVSNFNLSFSFAEIIRTLIPPENSIANPITSIAQKHTSVTKRKRSPFSEMCFLNRHAASFANSSALSPTTPTITRTNPISPNTVQNRSEDSSAVMHECIQRCNSM